MKHKGNDTIFCSFFNLFKVFEKHLILGGWQNGIFEIRIFLLCVSSLSNNSTDKEFLYIEAVGRCLGEVGPIDFSTIAIQHSKDTSYTKALELFEDKELQWTLIMLTYLNNTLIEDWWVINDTLFLITLTYLTFKENDTSHRLTFPIT